MVYSVDSLESFEAVEKTWLPACVDVFGYVEICKCV